MTCIFRFHKATLEAESPFRGGKAFGFEDDDRVVLGSAFRFTVVKRNSRLTSFPER